MARLMISCVGSFADIEDAGAVPIREKILEALMHRFEVYAPIGRKYRP